MFRKKTGQDISDEEFFRFQLPHIKICNKYLEEYIISDYIAFYIATGYYLDALYESSYLQHFNSAADMFNLSLENRVNVMNNTKKILEIKYLLTIVEEFPILKIKEI